MAMEIELLPSKVILAFDSLNRLAEQEHATGYVQAFSSVLKCLGCFVGDDSIVEIPADVFDNDSCNMSLNLKEKQIRFGDLVSISPILGDNLYRSSEYEIIFVINVKNKKFKLICYSDPVVFTFEPF